MNVKPKLLIKPEFGSDVCLNCFTSTIKAKDKNHTMVMVRSSFNKKNIQITNSNLNTFFFT